MDNTVQRRKHLLGGFRELYYPGVLPFQVWLATLSFALFIVSVVFKDFEIISITRSINAVTTDKQLMIVVGLLFLLLSVWAFLSLACIVVRFFIGVKEQKDANVFQIGARDSEGYLYVYLNKIKQLYHNLISPSTTEKTDTPFPAGKAESDDPFEFDKASNAYRACLDLWKLASHQIYSRFSTMLTANSIILGIIGLSFTERFNIPPEVRKWLIWPGILLCFAWILFMIAGWQVECHYRNKYDYFEKYAIPADQKIPIPFCDWRSWFFLVGTSFTILIFIAIYIILLWKSG